MSFAGTAVSLKELDNNIVELHFDNKKFSVNKLDKPTVEEIDEVLDIILADSSIKGVLLTSGKSLFIAGADVTEFTPIFKQGKQAVVDFLSNAKQVFNKLEDLPIPTVSAVNGAVLGGGLELALCTDLRVATPEAILGFPEVTLGIMPGSGGSVRTPRIIGIDNAIEWVCSGRRYKAEKALAVGMVDAVCQQDQLRDSALLMLQQAIAGKLDINQRKSLKTSPVQINETEKQMAFMTGISMVSSQSNKNMPAPLKALESMQACVDLNRNEALDKEIQSFAELSQLPSTHSLIGLFINEKQIMKQARMLGSSGKQIKNAAVLGAGIMGGGIAYQSAVRGTPIHMKDIAQAGLAQGMNEATKLLSKQVITGRIDVTKMANVLNNIHPTLNYDGFDGVDMVVEAVVENENVKTKVLVELEKKVNDKTIIASNTSTISISKMAENLQRPENFCGMHFFNPVHKMSLVEVIRGEKSSEVAIASTVNYALAMGKKPIVVNDCAGFYVNRVLFPYVFAFDLLLQDGVDFQRIDKVMEQFGWPMGPAYLVDVVGLDTACHGGSVMANAFPERMKFDQKSPIKALFEANRLGQKNGGGFYSYGVNKKGLPIKRVDESIEGILANVVKNKIEITDAEIVDRLMIPMANEVVRCLEEGIVNSCADADMGLILGIGFPVWRGGICRYLDQISLEAFLEKAKSLEHMGLAYQSPELLSKMATENKTFY